MADDEQEEVAMVPFHCPKCGEDETAEVIYGAVFADPSLASIRCGTQFCRALWRVELVEVRNGNDKELNQ